MGLGWGERAKQVLVDIAPMEVDVWSSEFLGCTPLLDLPPAAAAAYLGTYLVSLLDGLEVQSNCVVFYDGLTRAHTIHCLGLPRFWEEVVRPHLSMPCRKALEALAHCLASRRDLLALSPEEVGTIQSLAAESVNP